MVFISVCRGHTVDGPELDRVLTQLFTRLERLESLPQPASVGQLAREVAALRDALQALGSQVATLDSRFTALESRLRE